MLAAQEPNFGKGIQLSAGFDLGAKAPLDSRAIVKTIEERDAHITGNRAYEGMLVYVEADKKTYQLVEGAWKEFGFNQADFNGSFETSIKPLEEKIEAVEERATDLEGRADSLEERVENLEERATNTEAKDEEQDGRLDAIESDIEAINDPQTGILAQAKEYTDSEIEKLAEACEEAREGLKTELSDKIGAVEEKADQVVADLAQEVLDRTAADEALQGNIDKVVSDLEAEVERAQEAERQIAADLVQFRSDLEDADEAIIERVEALEGQTADLEEIREAIAQNTSAIEKEVEDREAAITEVKGEISAEEQRATAAEEALAGRLDVIEGEGPGSIKAALEAAKADATAKADKALEDAKSYTDAEIEKVTNAADDLASRVETLEDEVALVDGKIANALQSAKDYTDAEIATATDAFKAADEVVLTEAKEYADAHKEVLEGSISALDGKVDAAVERISANETEIQNIKDALGNKNSNTLVVDSMAEFESIVGAPDYDAKVGDLVFVIDVKKTFIFKGKSASTLNDASLPEGWVYFDEITTEVDLVDYLKKDEAAATYRRLDTAIEESDLAADLAQKINDKADKSYVDDELAKKLDSADVDGIIKPLEDGIAANEEAIAQEVEDRKSEIERVEGLISDISGDLTDGTSSLMEEIIKLQNRLTKSMTVVGTVEPTDTETGHVWLEVQ